MFYQSSLSWKVIENVNIMSSGYGRW
jgi:hypothetical protein